MSDRERYAIVLEARHDGSIPPVARLKAFRKAAWRQWDFKCVELRACDQAEQLTDDLQDK